MPLPRLLITSLCIAMLVVSIHSFWQKAEKSPQAPEILFGIPVYPESKLNMPMSGTGDPHIFVFLSDDSLEQVLAFYDEAFKAKPKVLSYGKSMIVYQYLITPSELANYPLKGVEVMAYNAFYQRVLHKRIKIKIYVPKEELGENPTPLSE